MGSLPGWVGSVLLPLPRSTPATRWATNPARWLRTTGVCVTLWTRTRLLSPVAIRCTATDILLTDQPGIALVQRFADCVPLVLYDPGRQVLALAHTGWRGTVQGVALEAVRAMAQAFGSHPGDIVAGVGPSIGPCCYEIGPEVAAQVRSNCQQGELFLSQADNAIHLDLWAANCGQLEEAGVDQVEVMRLCTACHNEEFFSHRAERGRTGRFGVMALLSA